VQRLRGLRAGELNGINNFRLAMHLHSLLAKVETIFTKKEPTMKTIHLITLAALTLVPAFAQNGQGPHGPQSQPPVAVQPATAEEIQALVFMREEEKLARDVYRFLFERWQYAAFDRIAASEQQHFATIGTLLTRYSIPDPAATDTPGVFADPKLTTMYAELTAKGAISLKDALEVGVLIEKTDIADLSAANTTTKLDIKRVYTNLMTASFSHLDAFESGLELLAVIQ
jgi:hypothetical protein